MPTAKSTVAIRRIKRPRVPTTRRRLHLRLSQNARITSKIVNLGTASKKISQQDFRFYLNGAERGPAEPALRRAVADDSGPGSTHQMRSIHAADCPLDQTIIFAVQHALRQPIALAVSIMTQGVEVAFDAQAGRSTEVIDQREPFICVPSSSNQGSGSGAGSRDGE